MIRQLHKEEQYIERMERKQLRKALRAHEKQKKEWRKAQDPVVQKRLKEDKKRTKQFYKKYGKAKTNVVPGKKPPRKKKVRGNGLMKK